MSSVREVQSPDASDIGRQWEREMAVRVMTAYVAHELNHPLGTIINLVNILSRRLADPVVRPKDISEHVQNIKAEAIRASSVIRNMRMLTEHKPPSHESLSLFEVCHDTIARMKPLAKTKQVKVRFEVRTAFVRVRGVKELLETALYNLVINSIAALEDANTASRLVIVRILTRDPAYTAIQSIGQRYRRSRIDSRQDLRRLCHHASRRQRPGTRDCRRHHPPPSRASDLSPPQDRHLHGDNAAAGMICLSPSLGVDHVLPRVRH